MIDIQRETPDQPEVAAFLSAADKRADTIYANQTRHGPDLSALVSAGVRYFVARENGRPFGGGGYVRLASHCAEMNDSSSIPLHEVKGSESLSCEPLNGLPRMKVFEPCFSRPA